MFNNKEFIYKILTNDENLLKITENYNFENTYQG